MAPWDAIDYLSLLSVISIKYGSILLSVVDDDGLLTVTGKRTDPFRSTFKPLLQTMHVTCL